MIKTSNILHHYSKEQRFSFPDLNCNTSETLLVLGQSGVGKTTLLHILAGILKPKEGKVIIDSVSLYEQSGNKLDKFRGKNIGLVFQKPHFVQSISAEENLMLTQKMAGQKIDRKKVQNLLERLGIQKRKTAKAHQMSQGEQQRLSIARALINDPKVILADEPTSALDDNNCMEAIKLLSFHAEEVNASLIVVTHDNRLKDTFSNQLILN